MSKPLVFISHKMIDRKIAETVARFVRDITGGQVDVFLSSSPDFEGPRVGKDLNNELKKALWDAGVVLLIYTLDDEDWCWCMWECGIAELPESMDTKVVVLQCREDKPKPFQAAFNVQAWQKDSLIALAYRFRETDFFPGRNEPVTGFKEEELKERAEKLHEELIEAMPRTTENWPAWPFLRLKMSRDLVEKLTVSGNQSTEECRKVLEEAKVARSSTGLAGLFGRTEVTINEPFANLIQEWTSAYPERAPDWLDVITQQILAGIKKKTPKIVKWELFRQVGGYSEFAVCIGNIKADQLDMHFDCYFLGSGEVPLISHYMVRRNRMYCYDLADKPPENIPLKELLDGLKEHNWSRVPILDNDKARYIIHTSMINEFIRKRAYAGKQVNDLTLKDLLDEKEMEDAKKLEVMSEKATLDDARRAMTKNGDCLDIFVTESGDNNEEVKGWLTDRDLAYAQT